MSTGIVFHSLAALSYASLAWILWRALSLGQPVRQVRRAVRLGVLGALILHGIGLYQSILFEQQLHLSWSIAFSAAVWLGMLVFWLESLLIRIDGLLLLLLPAGALSCLMVALFPKVQLIARADDTALRMHLLIALCAYGLITIAAVQAILMSALDHRLRAPSTSSHLKSSFKAQVGKLLDAQPSLLSQEQLLFRVIWVAFGALTLAVMSGSMISLAATGQVLPIDHKTVFTLLSWLTFGVLLAGRHIWGWRGRIALRYTLVGFAFIVLAYTGSRFVVEIILQRT
jgi:ABC-type uncharacterized transport system permease subunit